MPDTPERSQADTQIIARNNRSGLSGKNSRQDWGLNPVACLLIIHYRFEPASKKNYL